MQQPAVSVIIPMYNTQRYVAECLDSLLAQTLTNFEVIIVDDCSTDSSPAIVQSYMPRFGGRLMLTRTKKNSGGCAVPRNVGLPFARGEYVYFMDSDDVLIPTGLEEMYTLAKKFDADTVYCERYFVSSGSGQDFINNVRFAEDNNQIQRIPPVDVPTLETDDMALRVKNAIEYHYWVTTWLKLVSRDLLVENDIKFPEILCTEDVNWTFKVLFCSKRFLRIPNPCYIWRINEKSITNRKRPLAQEIHKLMGRTICTLKDMDNFMREIAFFRENPIHRYNVINRFVEIDFYEIFKICESMPPFELYNIFLELFGKYLGEHDVLVAELCTLVHTLRKICHDLDQDMRNFSEKVVNKTYEIEKIMMHDKAYIAELENEIRRLKNKE